MSTLTKEDVHFCLTRVPKDVRALLQAHPVVLAGGFIRETIAGGRVNDLDLFGYSKEALRSVAVELALSRKGRLHETENAYTVLAPPRSPVQFVTRWLVSDPAEYINNFDFTVCQAAIWWDAGEWHSAASPYFYPDLAARRLTYTHPKREEEPGGSMLRVRKFISRGYDIQVQSLAAVMSRVFCAVDVNRINASDEREVARIVHGLLRDVDPNVIIDGFDMPDSEIIAQ